ncbi:hypothetical protein PPL_06878 [Heterostelium album PN500]|uniref:Uncharacterized protein n=1 Tax=Heterostelium pallidum (strain ATCC 26659 / Pp 5 / PN500) TaxID=670386 RepID=D3BDS5_HETP5|nr:hypothetical protein PPL_06878 [Heterostelium album PN500]EFA80056.1 hypothetical protein PPL_06878 [Heterostelium album PN500]|eukprot:XP_020432176.1 hypothetical protein PPL_06878 [Heterostelium album PN500]
MDKLTGQWKKLCESTTGVCNARVSNVGFKDTDYYMGEMEDESSMLELNVGSGYLSEKFYFYASRTDIADKKHDIYGIGKLATPYSMQACQGNRFYFTIQTDNYFTSADYLFQLKYATEYPCGAPERSQRTVTTPQTMEPQPSIRPRNELAINAQINKADAEAKEVPILSINNGIEISAHKEGLPLFSINKRQQTEPSSDDTYTGSLEYQSESANSKNNSQQQTSFIHTSLLILSFISILLF